MTLLNNQQMSVLTHTLVSYSTLYSAAIIYLMFLTQDREKHKKLSIGVLDVFGFEVFKTNGFEQLCINYCNETLQQFYLNHIFKLEQNRCASEGMQLEHIDFQDNKETLNLLANQRLSIIDLIHEEVKVPKVRPGSQYYATQASEMKAKVVGILSIISTSRKNQIST